MAGEEQAEAARTPVTFVHRYLNRGLVTVNGDQLYIVNRRLTVDEPAQIEVLNASGDFYREAAC